MARKIIDTTNIPFESGGYVSAFGNNYKYHIEQNKTAIEVKSYHLAVRQDFIDCPLLESDKTKSPWAVGKILESHIRNGNWDSLIAALDNNYVQYKTIEFPQQHQRFLFLIGDTSKILTQLTS